jgi:hypothetical protein
VRHLTRLVSCGAAAGAAIIMLAGCSGGGGGITTPATGNVVQQDSVSMRYASNLSPAGPIGRPFPLLSTQGSRVPVKAFVNSAALAKQSTMIAVSDVLHNAVDIFSLDGTQLAQLTGFAGPGGLASDSKGNLYVADAGNSRVQVYSAGFTSPPTSLSTEGHVYGVDSFNNGQVVAAADIVGNQGLGNVKFFTNGQLINSVSSVTLPYIYRCAFDATGNLYVLAEDVDFHVRLGEVVGGAHGSTINELTTTNVMTGAVDLSVTTNGQIAVETQGCCGDHRAIYTYNKPVGSSLGTPVSITPLSGTNPYKEAFAFTNDMSGLYTVDDHGTVQHYAYPIGGNPLSNFRIPSSELDGVAVIAQSAKSIR